MFWRPSACMATTLRCRSGQRQDGHGPHLGLRARRSTASSASPQWPLSITPRETGAGSIRSAIWRTLPASFRLMPIAALELRPVRGGAQTGAHHSGALLGACPTAVLRVGRHRQERPTRTVGDGDLPDRAGCRPTHRRAVRHRAHDQWAECRLRRRVRQEKEAPLLAELETWLRDQLIRFRNLT